MARSDDRSDPRRAVLAFDEAVERLGEEAAFLAAGRDHQAARYVADARAALTEPRDVMHALESLAADTSLRTSVRRRLHALAVGIAESGLRDAEHVSASARRLAGTARSGEESGWGERLRMHTVRATAWGVERWTGSPVHRAELRSMKTASEALVVHDALHARGRLQPVRRLPGRRRAAIAAGVVGGAGTLSLAAYGAWELLAPLFG